MLKKKNLDFSLSVKKRTLTDKLPNLVLNEEEISKLEYEKLKNHLKLKTQDNIRNKIIIMKILLEIRDKKYYKLDKYNTFYDFIKDYNYHIAKTQAYKYLKIAESLVEGKIEEALILEKGISFALKFIKQKTQNTKNDTQTIQFKIKDKEIFNFVNKNKKFFSAKFEEYLKVNLKKLKKELNNYD